LTMVLPRDKIIPSTMAETSQGLPLSAVRAYTMVVKTLRERIDSGQYPIGAWLPTERILGEDLNVDRRVVRAAVNQLIWDGYVDRKPHCRPTVIKGKQEQTDTAEPAAASNTRAPLSLLVRNLNTSTQPTVASPGRDPLSPSNFVALIMWGGGGVLENQTSQQRIFWGINQALSGEGYHAVFLDLGQLEDEKENAEREASHLRYVMDRGLGGAILYPYAYRSNQALIHEVMRYVPLVLVDRRIAPLETDFVCTANYKAMFDMVMHLVRQGHQRIAYLTKYEPIQPVQDRTRGYIDAVREANLNEIILPIPSHDAEWDWTAVDAVFSLPEGKRPTAAAVFNDYAAYLFQDRLEHLGLFAPGDVALTGFDNIAPSLQNGLGLTTVAQPYEEMGLNAAQLLLRRLKDPLAPFESIELPGKLIIRESSSSKISG